MKLSFYKKELFAAVTSHNAESLKDLLNKRLFGFFPLVNPNAFDRRAISPLQYAVMNGNILLTALLLKAGANTEPQQGISLLWIAAVCGQQQICRLFLAAGADVPFVAAHYPVNTGLLSQVEHWADGQQRPDKALIDQVIQAEPPSASCSVLTNSQSQLIFSQAVMCEDGAVIAMMVDNGYPVNQRDNSGYTALQRAALNGKTKSVGYLLAAGADITVSSRQGASLSPLQLVCKHQPPNRSAILKALLGNVKDCDDFVLVDLEAALIESLKNNDMECVSLLLNADAPVSGKVVYFAVVYSKAEILDRLLDKISGLAVINEKINLDNNTSNQTPLSFAQDYLKRYKRRLKVDMDPGDLLRLETNIKKLADFSQGVRVSRSMMLFNINRTGSQFNKSTRLQVGLRI